MASTDDGHQQDAHVPPELFGSTSSSSAAIFHERQVWMNCGKHALNSLLGEHWATTELLTEVAQNLRREHAAAAGHDTLINPYHHWAGPWMGNWDIMVLCEALKLREMAVTQHVVFNQAAPERLEEALSELCAALDEPETVGIILNRESTSWVLKMISGHHWYALARETAPEAGTGQQQYAWYNKDSNLKAPELLGDGSAGAVAEYVRNGATSVQLQAFLVQRVKAAGVMGESGLSPPP